MLYQEPFRPQFHYTPKNNWMNDPNGLVYYDSTYHMFYQYHPNSSVWGPMHWGHATSKDLIHWKEESIALYPDSLGKIFSGSAIVDKNNTAGFGKNAMVAVFTHHSDSLWIKGYRNTEVQSLAYSLDNGLNWKKYKNNPVIANSNEKDFRDPKVFWNEDKKIWNMVLSVGDRVKIFASDDLIDWKFKSDFKPKNDLNNLGVWECPDLFKMNYQGKEKWVLIISHGNNTPNGGSGTRYFIGNFDGETFTNEQASTWLDLGFDYYAGITFSNVPENKKILIAWMSNWLYAQKTPTEVWRSAMTLPRELLLDYDNTAHIYFLRQNIVNQFQEIKTKIKEYKNVRLPFRKENHNLMESDISFDSKGGDDIEITFSNELGESISLGITNNIFFFDRRKSGITDFDEKFSAEIQRIPLNDNIHKFQIVLDKSSCEILLNDGKYSITNLIFPTNKYTKLDIKGDEGLEVENLRVEKINSIWK
ncbi:MAG: glycoside hydrolase family 32 protein [Flavobacteriales bacterium]|nr:glycoside hydrolase family 32 protein [Flavobacteriales bacterium]